MAYIAPLNGFSGWLVAFRSLGDLSAGSGVSSSLVSKSLCIFCTRLVERSKPVVYYAKLHACGKFLFYLQ